MSDKSSAESNVNVCVDNSQVAEICDGLSKCVNFRNYVFEEIKRFDEVNKKDARSVQDVKHAVAQIKVQFVEISDEIKKLKSKIHKIAEHQMNQVKEAAALETRVCVLEGDVDYLNSLTSSDTSDSDY